MSTESKTQNLDPWIKGDYDEGQIREAVAKDIAAAMKVARKGAFDDAARHAIAMGEQVDSTEAKGVALGMAVFCAQKAGE